MPIILDRKNDNVKLQRFIEAAKTKFNTKSGEKAMQCTLEFVFDKYPLIEKEAMATAGELEELQKKYDTIMSALRVIKKLT